MDQVSDRRAWMKTLDELLTQHLDTGVEDGALTWAEAAELRARISTLVDQGLAAAY